MRSRSKKVTWRSGFCRVRGSMLCWLKFHTGGVRWQWFQGIRMRILKHLQLVPAGCHLFSTIVFGGVSRKKWPSIYSHVWQCHTHTLASFIKHHGLDSKRLATKICHQILNPPREICHFEPSQVSKRPCRILKPRSLTWWRVCWSGGDGQVAVMQNPLFSWSICSHVSISFGKIWWGPLLFWPLRGQKNKVRGQKNRFPN